MENPEILNQSAELLAGSRRVLFLTSAGMSADSNIPTFRDKDGYWRNFPPFKEKKPGSAGPCQPLGVSQRASPRLGVL